MREVGEAQSPYCVVPYKDAGHLCVDKSQCRGFCVAIVRWPAGIGQCQRDNTLFGCNSLISRGVAEQEKCVD